MDKTDLLSIKEFSRFTGIKQSTLRYYDEIKLFRPVFRGENNYRYYNAQQITTVNLINVLASLDISRKEIIRLTHDRNPSSILKLFSEQEELLNTQIRRISESHSVIHTFQKLIETGNSAQENEICEYAVSELPISLGPKNRFPKNSQFYHTFMEYCDHAKEYGVNLSYPIGGYYEDVESFMKNPSQPTHFFSVTPTGKSKKPAGRYLVGYARGYYGEMGDLPQRFHYYAKENNLSLQGPLYAIYLHDEVSSLKPDEYLVQVSALIEK